MTLRPILVAAGSSALVAAGLLTAPAVQAATTVTVNCATSSSEAFTVSAGEQIIFDLNTSCQTDLGSYLTFLGGATSANLQVIVNRMAVLTGTGGTAVANISGSSYTVTYTAGPRSGTDYLDVSNTGATRSRGYRTLSNSNSYSMTIPGSDQPAPWLQAYARRSADTCQTGWSPSWAEWPNGGTGGFTCERSYIYNRATDVWDVRGIRR
jgi:hypothetical protein